MRVAIYLRVSTKDGRQDTMNQRLQLEEYAQAQPGWEIVQVYEDRKSGKSTDRDEFQAMFQDAAKHRFDLLLFWSLDRFTRTGILSTFLALNKLDALQIRYRSHRQPFCDTTTPAGQLLTAIFAWIAEQERSLISERTKAGMAKNKAEKKAGPKGYVGAGRPHKGIDMIRARQLLAMDVPKAEIARILGCKRTTLLKRLKTPIQPR